MKKIYFLLLSFITLGVYAQEPYYDGIDFTLPPEQLYDALQTKLENYNTSFNYGDARDLLRYDVVDEYEHDSSKVVLLYGYDDDDNNCTTDYTRLKTGWGGQHCEYNREHVFPRSLANPGMGNTNNNYTGIVADPHNIRACDQQMNLNRVNYRFGPGSGTAGVVVVQGENVWYPGDEFKGDIARMMMYMYVRYGDRCLPTFVGQGDTMDDNDMLELFLEWNAEDPVSYLETQRNDRLEDVYGNRNPFIDNPRLATILWGGTPAEDRWGTLDVPKHEWHESISIYPNPATETIWVETSTENPNYSYTLYSITGQEILNNTMKNETKKAIPVRELSSGTYILNIKEGNNSVNKQVIVK